MNILIEEFFTFNITILLMRNSSKDGIILFQITPTTHLQNIFLTCILTFELVSLKFEPLTFFHGTTKSHVLFQRMRDSWRFADCVKVEAVARIKCF